METQTFRDFEIILTDDSPDDSVRILSKKYESSLSIVYHKNESPLGTPENWNKAISLSSGEWVKLMHDDDWFYANDSMWQFAQAAKLYPDRFIFSAYENVFLDLGVSKIVYPQKFRLKLLSKNAVTLFSQNCIGPPSVVMHKNNGHLRYDSQTKWVVDIGFYMERLKNEKMFYIDQPLVRVGMSSEQVTVSCINDKEILIRENFYLLKRQGWNHLRNLCVYDAFWRLIRNLRLNSIEEIRNLGYSESVPICIENMIRFQATIPRMLLNVGFVSKFIMSIHYFLNLRKIK